MAIYEVRHDDSNGWDDGNSRRRFNTRPPADRLFEEERDRGQSVRLIRWHKNQLKELRRSDRPPRGRTN